MFLKGDVRPGSVRGARKWRLKHARVRESLQDLEASFMESGTVKERENLEMIREARRRIMLQRKGVLPELPLSQEGGLGKLPDIYQPRKKRYAFKRKGTSHSSGSSVLGLELSRRLKQLCKGIERNPVLRSTDDVEWIFDQLERHFASLVCALSKLQKLVISLVKEVQGLGKDNVRDTTTIEACLGILKAELAAKKGGRPNDDDEEVERRSPQQDFFARCLSSLSSTERDLLWLMVYHGNMFQEDLSPADPLITCSIVIRLLYRRPKHGKLLSLAGAIKSKRRELESGTETETEIVKTCRSYQERIPAIGERKKQNARQQANPRRRSRRKRPEAKGRRSFRSQQYHDSFDKWEVMISTNNTTSMRSSALPRLPEVKNAKAKSPYASNLMSTSKKQSSKVGGKKSTSGLYRALNGPLAKGKHRRRSSKTANKK
mmetsp:Transcript_7235/g.13470  ORF Transcript_7235/g.13470 Transcript_7235/m.13470 type:complete len:432 (+) Transcript_7235:213-1508(+)